MRAGVGADAVTWAGFALGLAAAGCIATGVYGLGLMLILASRLMDGLDGAVARLTQPTDRGAFLDITLDFMFYASIPLAFGWADPERNALAAAALLAAFVGTGSTSLAYPNKGLYYLGGLTEAGETLVAFGLMCGWPQAFAIIAWVFAGLCGLTVLARLWAGWKMLSSPGNPAP